MNKEIENFISDYVKDLNEGTAAIFVGAGLSKGAGFVNWSELLSEIADELGLDIKQEYDLVSLAQYHVNENRNKSKIIRKIIEEFNEDIELTENHEIIARLPITSIWTTNYDQLIEKAIKNNNKVVDVKYNIKQLITSKSKRDVALYKMHGDVDHPADAILTKEQYEHYYQTHEPFITALSGELITKTFLFLGFSFTDPNLDYILGRLNYRYRENKRQHYCFVKKHKLGDYQNPDKVTFEYNQKKQNLINNDLKRYGIKPLLIDDYSEITEVLSEIETRYRKGSIFISGSAENYGVFSKHEGRGFIHRLSQALIKQGYRIINGFGLGVGTSVINGALQEIYSNQNKYSEDQLVMKPFPQFETGKVKLPTLWDDYRKQMISMSGIAIFLFGNKLDKDGNIIEANGVIREFEIANEKRCVLIPIGLTGHAAKTIYETIEKSPKDFYEEPKKILPILKRLSSLDKGETPTEKIKLIIELLKKIHCRTLLTVKKFLENLERKTKKLKRVFRGFNTFAEKPKIS